MAIPNRFKEVDALCKQHPEAFVPGDGHDAARLNFLAMIVIPQLNLIDGGNWGLMTKTEQNGKIPVDIMMWRITREFVDCLTSSGAMWGEFPPAPVTWVWTAVGTVPPTPTPVPPTPQPPASSVQYDEAQGVAFQQDVQAAYAAAGQALDLGNVIWSNRMTWDARDLGYPKSREKHLSQLKLELKG